MPVTSESGMSAQELVNKMAVLPVSVIFGGGNFA
jgi:hypothetical protein